MDPAAPAAPPAGPGSGLVQRSASSVPNTTNNSWPDLKTSQPALRTSALLAALQPPADQPAPGAYRRPNQRLRPRTQHLQRPVSSVDSAIAPPVSGMAVIETVEAERSAAEGTTSLRNTGNSAVAWAVPAEADGQQANGLDATTSLRAVGAHGFMRLNSRAAAAAAAGTYMRMRPSHLYRSISTVYAMYSPLRGGLRALGHCRNPPPGDCQANTAFVHFHEENGCCPQLISHTTGIARTATGHAEDVRLQELLGGCSTVPEEGVLLDQPMDEQLVQQCCPALFTTAECEAQQTGTAVQRCAAAADDAEVAVAVQDESFVAEYQLTYLHQEFYLPQQLAAEVEQQQEEQEKDVVQRGPVFAPAAPAPVHVSSVWSVAQRAGGGSNVVRTTSCSNPSPGMGNRTGLATAARQHASMPSQGEEQGTGGCSGDYVATYHNPMTALEDAGFHSADDAMLVQAVQEAQKLNGSHVRLCHDSSTCNR
eukprot:gene7606-7808_t